VVGIGITLISCACYVITWEVVYFHFMHDFMDKYSADMVERLRAAGATAAVIAAKVEEMKRLKAMYENPFYNAALTFLEPFPVGLVITLISAAILKRKELPKPPLPAAS